VGSGCAIYLNRPGASTRVRTWTPKAGHFHGFLITHSEAISLADYYTVMDGERVAYRPTSHYAYHPSDNAVLSVHEFAGNNWHLQDRKRIMLNEITGGIDELGVLLAGHKKNAYWYGSQLSIEEARKLAPYNSATSLQVTVAALSGMIWAMENPQPRHRRARRHGFRAPARDLHALPGEGGRRIHGLDAAAPARRAVCRGSRHGGSLAVQERSGGLSA
jgi:homospermidine synthase